MATTEPLRGTRQMILGMELGNTSGTQQASWRAPASAGRSVRDILSQGVFDEHPAKVGTAADAGDHMQEWVEFGAVDGFWICVDVYRDAIDAFVDRVVAILQECGLFHRDYEGTTFREHLGARDQYGPDYRVTQTARPSHSTRPFATVNR